MNKLNKLIGSLLLSAFMLIGVGVSGNTKDVIRGNAEVRSITLNTDFFSELSGTSYKTTSNTDSVSGVTFNISNCNVNNGLNMKASTGAIWNSTSFGSKKILSLELKGIKFSSSKNAGFYVYGGNSEKSTTTTLLNNSGSTSDTSLDFSQLSYDFFYIKNKGSRTTAFQSIVINYEEGSSVATKIASASLIDSSKVFYCGEEISSSDFIVKDDTGATITDFTIDKTTVPSDAGDFTLTFSKEGLTSFDLSLTAVAKVLDFELSTTSISGMVGKKVNVKATANKFIENPAYLWEVSEGSDIVTLSATSGDNVDVTLANIGTAKIKVTETTSNVSKEIDVTAVERVSTLKQPVEEVTTDGSKTVYEMVGKVTGVYGKSYVIQDGEYAMYIYITMKALQQALVQK